MSKRGKIDVGSSYSDCDYFEIRSLYFLFLRSGSSVRFFACHLPEIESTDLQ